MKKNITSNHKIKITAKRNLQPPFDFSKPPPMPETAEEAKELLLSLFEETARLANELKKYET